MSDGNKQKHLLRLFQRNVNRRTLTVIHPSAEACPAVDGGEVTDDLDCGAGTTAEHNGHRTKCPGHHKLRRKFSQWHVRKEAKEKPIKEYVVDGNMRDNAIMKLAHNSLNLVGPVTDMVRVQQQNWLQLSGHTDSLALAGPGTLWKKVSGSCSVEMAAYSALMNEQSSRHLVPEFYGQVQHNGEYFIEIEDLLFGFNNASVMDVKMGTRTFLESEVENPTPRKDLYKKMIALCPEEPTCEEKLAEAITKLRYMQFRERVSSSSALGFRIEGLKVCESGPLRGLKHLMTRADVTYTMCLFVRTAATARSLLENLRAMRQTLEQSSFFARHQMIGSSILLVYDKLHSGTWIIDLAKTVQVPDHATLDHRRSWQLGNMEDGYLTGLDNLIKCMEDAAIRLGGQRA